MHNKITDTFMEPPHRVGDVVWEDRMAKVVVQNKGGLGMEWK